MKDLENSRNNTEEAGGTGQAPIEIVEEAKK